MSGPLEALNAGDHWDFIANSHPKCPHCGAVYDISEHEAWHLYDAGEAENDVVCSSCECTFRVKTIVEYTFSTDEQPDIDESGCAAIGQTRRPNENEAVAQPQAGTGEKT